MSTRRWFAQVGKIFGLAGATYGLAWIILGLRGALTPGRLIAAYLLATSAFLLTASLTMTEQLRDSLWSLPAMSRLRRAETNDGEARPGAESASRNSPRPDRLLDEGII